jgi:cytochrome c biogenesis protein CcdA
MVKKTKEKVTTSIAGIIAGIVGVLVSLSVGSGMATEVLKVPYILPIITVVAGWIVIIGTILSVVMALFGK